MAAKVITRPDNVASQTFARTFVEHVVRSDLPIFGGGFGAMASIALSSEHDFEMALWRSENGGSSENLVQLVVARIRCSELALRIGIRICKRLDNGLSEPVTFDEIAEAFPGTNEAEILSACGELEGVELVMLIHGTNDSGQVHAQNRLFETFDLIVHRVNPRADAAEIARYMVALPANQVVATHEIVTAFGWNKRRLNPALSIVGEMVGQGRTTRLIEKDFFLTHMAPNLSERVELRAFADRTLGPVP